MGHWFWWVIGGLFPVAFMVAVIRLAVDSISDSIR